MAILHHQHVKVNVEHINVQLLYITSGLLKT